MCRLNIPHHPWCNCADPNPGDGYRSSESCPHHIHLTAADYKLLPKTVKRPEPFWSHCSTFRRHECHGDVGSGDEIHCPKTSVQGEHKVLYSCYGLCNDCLMSTSDGTMGSPSGLLLPLVKLGWSEDEEEAEKGWWWIPDIGMLDFTVRDVEWAEAWLATSQAATDGYTWGERRVHVDVIRGDDGSIDLNRSAVYLFPSKRRFEKGGLRRMARGINKVFFP